MKTLLSLMFLLLSLTAQAADRSGEEVFNCTCIVCHGGGYLNAPKKGDTKRWGKLIKEGLDDIVPEGLHGVRAMPAKGGNPNLSDIEFARAVVFMANASGGTLPEPTEEQVKTWRAKADAKGKKQKP